MAATDVYEEIKAEGRKEGREQGGREGREALLLRMLARKFGDVPADVAARIHAATTDDLDRWGEALVTATTLESVFQ